jgi:glutamine amidotransferase
MIAIINYGIGNLGSIQNIIKHIGGSATITSDPEVVRTAKVLILPGVGSFDSCVKALRASKLLDLIETRVHQEKTPILGICVGMQMMAKASEEGIEPGLGWVAARVEKLRPDPASGLKVPHLGWRSVECPANSPLRADPDRDPRFYFAHSYHVVCEDASLIAATCDYGGRYVAALSTGNIFAVQFHPEKSHRCGMRFFENFLKRAGALPVRAYDAL